MKPTKPFDAADYLISDEDIIAYIEVVLEDGTKLEARKALETVARALRRR